MSNSTSSEYTISCYQNKQVVWRISTTSLSELALFVINSEKHRASNLYENADASIVISKEWPDCPQANMNLEHFLTNNPEAIYSIATNY